MANTTDRVTTAEQLAALPDDGRRYELVNGIVQMMSPGGFRHGQVAARLLSRISAHVERHELGSTLAAETGFRIRHDPDTVLAPDVAFVARDRLTEFTDRTGYLPLAPDLVGEVISPHDRSSEVEAKAQRWLDAGVRVVLVVDPQTSTLREYRSGRPIQVYSAGRIDLSDILPGFQLDVADMFA